MTRLVILALAAIGFLAEASAQGSRRQLVTNLETAEGASLKHLAEEADLAKKTALMESFVAKFPAHVSTGWVLGELQRIYLQSNQFAKALAAGEKILAGDPDDIAIAHGNLKAAEGAKDAMLIRKWAGVASATARRVLATPPPANGDAAAWQIDVEYARRVDPYCDYALYMLASQFTDLTQRIELSDLLTKQSPTSPYGALLRQQVFIAYQQAGDAVRALAMAEDDIRANRANDDMLLYAASKAFERHDKTKVTLYSKRLIEKLATLPLPEGMTAAEWTRNRSMKLGLAQWMLGVIASNEQRWPDADIHLRAALPNMGQNKAMAAEALYHLGLANYKMGEARNDKARIADALKYNMQCAAIAGNFQAQAKQNVVSIRSQFHLQ